MRNPCSVHTGRSEHDTVKLQEDTKIERSTEAEAQQKRREKN